MFLSRLIAPIAALSVAATGIVATPAQAAEKDTDTITIDNRGVFSDGEYCVAIIKKDGMTKEIVSDTCKDSVKPESDKAEKLKEFKESKKEIRREQAIKSIFDTPQDYWNYMEKVSNIEDSDKAARLEALPYALAWFKSILER